MHKEKLDSIWQASKRNLLLTYLLAYLGTATAWLIFMRQQEVIGDVHMCTNLFCYAMVPVAFSLTKIFFAIPYYAAAAIAFPHLTGIPFLIILLFLQLIYFCIMSCVGELLWQVFKIIKEKLLSTN